MITIDKIKQQRDALAHTLQAEDAANAEAVEAQREYDKLIERHVEQLRAELEAQNAHIVAHRDEKREAAAALKSQIAAERDALKAELGAYAMVADAGDKKPLPGLARRDSVVAIVHNKGNLILEAMERAPFLLTLDMGAVEKFVSGFTVTDADGTVRLADSVRDMFQYLDVQTVHTWTISNPTLKKLQLPEAEPEEATDVEATA